MFFSHYHNITTRYAKKTTILSFIAVKSYITVTYFNIFSNDFGIVAYRLHKENLNQGDDGNCSSMFLTDFYVLQQESKLKTNFVTIFFAEVEDDLSALRRRVGGIENLAEQNQDLYQ